MTGATGARGATGKRGAALAVLVPVAVLLALATRPWVSGRSGDVLSRDVLDVTGSTAAPGAVGLALVCAAGLLALMTGGRVIRTVAAGVVVLAAAGAFVIVLGIALGPRDAVAAALASTLGRTSAPDATGTASPWAWAAVVTCTALVAGTALVALSSRRWSGLSDRYEVASDGTRATEGEPSAGGPSGANGPRGQVRSAWDELSDGHDPTLRDGPSQT